jgi:hypothetical protein
MELDTISKVFSEDKEGFFILTYFDITVGYTKEELHEYILQIVDTMPFLKKEIVSDNGKSYMTVIKDFNVENYYTYTSDVYENFDSYVEKYMNEEMPYKWFFNYVQDIDKKKYRVYFKICHAYADGYKIIEMLTLNKANHVKVLFDRKKKEGFLSQLYYAIVGTIVLIVLNLNVFLNIITSEVVLLRKETIEYIKCKTISLEEIRKTTQYYKISVNDWLYSLMVRTDYIYTQTERELSVMSSINVTNTEQNNNIAPITIQIMNSLKNEELFNKTHYMMNCYKYSLYIPLLLFTLKFRSIISICGFLILSKSLKLDIGIKSFE